MLQKSGKNWFKNYKLKFREFTKIDRLSGATRCFSRSQLIRCQLRARAREDPSETTYRRIRFDRFRYSPFGRAWSIFWLAVWSVFTFAFLFAAMLWRNPKRRGEKWKMLPAGQKKSNHRCFKFVAFRSDFDEKLLGFHDMLRNFVRSYNPGDLHLSGSSTKIKIK